MSSASQAFWSEMSLEDYAALELATKARLTRAGGVFWRSVRPCFYRPVFPFQQLDPALCRPPLLHHLGCAQYAVRDSSKANSNIATLIYDELSTYKLESVSANLRKKIRKAQNHFRIERIEDRELLITQGFPVYQAFMRRTNYAYNRERQEQARFADWIDTLLGFPSVRILGAFGKERLHAIGISYRIGEVICYATFFAETEALGLHVSDLMLHTIRGHAAEESAARIIFARYSTGERGLDEYYLQRGAHIHRIPARIEGNIATLGLLRLGSPKRFRQLYGIEAPVPSPVKPPVPEDPTPTSSTQEKSKSVA